MVVRAIRVDDYGSIVIINSVSGISGNTIILIGVVSCSIICAIITICGVLGAAIIVCIIFILLLASAISFPHPYITSNP